MTPIAETTLSRLSDTCRWFLGEVAAMDISDARARLQMRVQAKGEVRHFAGFNRAKHAVLEAAILATRVGILPDDELLGQLASVWPWVQKTGGPTEHESFQFLRDYINNRISVGVEEPRIERRVKAVTDPP